MKSIVKIKMLNKDALMPNRAREGDAGIDIFSSIEKLIRVGESALINTGIQLELPKNTEAQIRPRSGLALNYSITVLNSPGTIDEGYRGELKIILINHGKEDFIVKKHMRIAQMVVANVLPIELLEVGELSNSKRGENGFGSSGL